MCSRCMHREVDETVLAPITPCKPVTNVLKQPPWYDWRGNKRDDHGDRHCMSTNQRNVEERFFVNVFDVEHVQFPTIVAATKRRALQGTHNAIEVIAHHAG
jgi:hypothetical protein